MNTTTPTKNYPMAPHPPLEAVSVDGYMTVGEWAWPTDTPGLHLITDRYVEDYWLPILGPTASWLHRRLVRSVLEARAVAAGGHATTPVNVHIVAAQIGVAAPTVVSSLDRLVSFHMARHNYRVGNVYEVRLRVPDLTPRQLTRLHDKGLTRP